MSPLSNQCNLVGGKLRSGLWLLFGSDQVTHGAARKVTGLDHTIDVNRSTGGVMLSLPVVNRLMRGVIEVIY